MSDSILESRPENPNDVHPGTRCQVSIESQIISENSSVHLTWHSTPESQITIEAAQNARLIPPIRPTDPLEGAESFRRSFRHLRPLCCNLAQARLVDFGVDRNRAEIPMAEKVSDGLEAIPVAKQSCGEGVPEDVGSC